MMDLPVLIKRQSLRRISFFFLLGICCVALLEILLFIYGTSSGTRPQFSLWGTAYTLHGDKSQDDRSTKWIVVLSDKQCDVTHFTRIPGWKVVVTGSKPLKGCRDFKHCTYIDEALEKSLAYRISRHVRANTESKKMIGYLYSIAHGATVIHDVDCSVIPRFNRIDFKLSGTTSGLFFTGGFFNHFAYLGFPMLYPRGFPVDSSLAKDQGTFQIGETRIPLVQQAQVNFEIGVTERLHLLKPMNTTFDQSTPPVFVSGHRYGPINAVNTLFLYDAFWALFLPYKGKGDSDITRGYLAQRLLNEINGAVGYVSSVASTHNKDTSRFLATSKTKDTYFERLVGAMAKWKCTKKDLFNCSLTLIEYLVKSEFLSNQDLNLYKAWISDLKAIGYRQPALKLLKNPVSNTSLWNPRVVYQSTMVVASEMHLLRLHPRASSAAFPVRQAKKVCPKLEYVISTWMNPTIKDIMLVVILNHHTLKTIPDMEFIYRIYFRHITYCGPDFERFSDLLKMTDMHHVTFIEGVTKNTTWFSSYQCLVHAASMNSNVKGYLYIGDDVLLNSWNIADMPRDRFWMVRGHSALRRSLSQFSSPFWSKPGTRKAANLFMDEVLKEAKRNPNDKMLKNFIQMYDQNVNISMVLNGAIDVFYIPAIFNKEIIRFGKIFRKHQTLSSLAIPMLRAGLGKDKDLVAIKGSSLGKEIRGKDVKSFQWNSFYLHPFKLATGDFSDQERRSFCEIYGVGYRKREQLVGT